MDLSSAAQHVCLHYRIVEQLSSSGSGLSTSPQHAGDHFEVIYQRRTEWKKERKKKEGLKEQGKVRQRKVE